jgi:hypothetical protein
MPALGDKKHIELEHEAGNGTDLVKGRVLQRFLGLFWQDALAHHAPPYAVARLKPKAKCKEKAEVLCSCASC